MIECVPTARDGVVNVATPLEFNVPEPMVVEPSLKFTVPVGVIPLPETVAVKVIGCEYEDWLAEEVSATEVPSFTMS